MLNYPNRNPQQLSPDGLDFIKRFEGLSLEPYKCAAGVWTVGYGHTGTLPDGTPVKDAGEITEPEAEDLLELDTQVAANDVNSLSLELTQEQFDALVSFVYNVGAPAFEKSKLYQAILNQDVDDIEPQFMRWVHAGGKRVRGLVKRRADEAKLFLKGQYE